MRLRSVAVGLVAGFSGSLAGLGGAFVALPFLMSPRLFGLSQHAAHGTSMAVALFTSIGGCIAYARQSTSDDSDAASSRDSPASSPGLPAKIGNIHLPTALGLATTGSAFAFLGARVSKRLPSRFLALTTATLLFCLSPSIAFREQLLSLRTREERPAPVPSQEPFTPVPSQESFTPAFLRAIPIGTLSGFQAGLLGVGGGAIMVPMLSFFTDLEFKQVLGTSLTAMLPTAIVGSLTHYRQGTMVLPIALPLGLGCFLGSLAGGSVVEAIGDRELRYFFSALLLVLASRTFLHAIRR
jgi:uncharacterized membrane protein YfcA